MARERHGEQGSAPRIGPQTQPPQTSATVETPCPRDKSARGWGARITVCPSVRRHIADDSTAAATFFAQQTDPPPNSHRISQLQVRIERGQVVVAAAPATFGATLEYVVPRLDNLGGVVDSFLSFSRTGLASRGGDDLCPRLAPANVEPVV